MYMFKIIILKVLFMCKCLSAHQPRSAQCLIMLEAACRADPVLTVASTQYSDHVLNMCVTCMHVK